MVKGEQHRAEFPQVTAHGARVDAGEKGALNTFAT